MYQHNYVVIKELMPVVLGLGVCFKGTSPFYLSTGFSRESQMTYSITKLGECELILAVLKSVLFPIQRFFKFFSSNLSSLFSML